MTTTTPSAAPRTNWSQVYSLLALNAAIVISWIAYHNYQPKVLEIFHFTELKVFLIIAQGLILVLIPPDHQNSGGAGCTPKNRAWLGERCGAIAGSIRPAKNQSRAKA